MFKRIKELFEPNKKENRDDRSAHRKYTTHYEDLCQ
jgi:hypothetical protein